MKPVAINARAAIRAEAGGVERCARELARRLPRLAPDRYAVLRPRPRLAHGAGHAWEQFALPLLARPHELVLSPANTAPTLLGERNVVMLYDLAPLREPDWFGGAYGAWHRRLLPLLARTSGAVIAPSRFVADELSELPRVEPGRVHVVQPGRELEHAEPDARALERLGISGRYVLAVGTDSPRKNIALLDELAPRLRGAGLECVVAGGARSYLPQTASGGGARRLGYVTAGELAALYNGAAALAMPSLYEGFGLPPLEAMAAGTPVVSSPRGALRETCGSAAVLVDPDDRGSFADALIAVAEPGRLRDQMVARGHERARAFGWDRAARKVDAIVGRRLGQS